MPRLPDVPSALVVGRHRGVLHILRAGQQPALIDDHELGVLIGVAGVDRRRGRCIRDDEPALPARVLDLLAHPPVLIADAADRPAFQQHRDAHARRRARRQRQPQIGVVEGVALIANARLRLADGRAHVLEDVVRRDQIGDDGRLRELGGLEVAVEVPAGPQHFLAVDGVVGGLRPVVIAVLVSGTGSPVV